MAVTKTSGAATALVRSISVREAFGGLGQQRMTGSIGGAVNLRCQGDDGGQAVPCDPGHKPHGLPYDGLSVGSEA